MSEDLIAAVHARPKRRQGITGQTIDAQMRGTMCQITEWKLEELCDELARLRAEVDRMTAERDESDRIATLRGNHIEFRLLPQMMDLESALADERRHADALAEALGKCMIGPGGQAAYAASMALAQHNARRQG